MRPSCPGSCDESRPLRLGNFRPWPFGGLRLLKNHALWSSAFLTPHRRRSAIGNNPEFRPGKHLTRRGGFLGAYGITGLAVIEISAARER